METLHIEKRPDGITILTFNRPDTMNALDLATMRHFAEVIESLHTDPDLRVLVLTGQGERAFCSGGDLVELSQYPGEADALDFITLMGDALRRMEQLPVPVFGAINGYALGGGSEIAIACDMRFADEKVRMGFVQIRLALTPGWGAGQRLLRLVGYSRAMDILLHGHVMHAPEVDKLGLGKVVPTGTALEHALNFAVHVAERPPDVVRGVKALLRAGLEHPYDNALAIERSIFPPLWAAEPHLSAVDAFLEKQAQQQKQKESNT